MHFHMSREMITHFLFVAIDDCSLFDMSREVYPRASSEKLLRVKSSYLESFRFLGLLVVYHHTFCKPCFMV